MKCDEVQSPYAFPLSMLAGINNERNLCSMCHGNSFAAAEERKAKLNFAVNLLPLAMRGNQRSASGTAKNRNASPWSSSR